MVNFLLFLLLAQIDFPDLPTPTPWETPTPNPVVEVAGDAQDDVEEILATTDATELDFEASGEQVYYENQALLPSITNSNSQILFGYFKWAVGSGTQSVFGPFAPLMIPLGILIFMGFISLFIYIWEKLIVTAFKLASFVINAILRIFGR